MENLYTALSLALVRQRRFVVWSNSSKTALVFERHILRRVCKWDKQAVCEINVHDILTTKTVDDLVIAMSSYAHNKHTFRNVILWKGVQLLGEEHQRQLYELLTQIDQYDTNGSRRHETPDVTINGSFTVTKPALMTIVLFMDHDKRPARISQYLKEKFWFATNYEYVSDQAALSECNAIVVLPSYPDLIRTQRAAWDEIYISPDVKRYVYSLVVHTRNHRLTSLAAKQTRLPTRAINYISELSVALVLWQGKIKYVTPDMVKIAYRKIAFWMVDWEYNKLYHDLGDDHDAERRLEIASLTGAWFGSDYDYVVKYLETAQSYRKETTPTGFSNQIVEDVLQAVRPPL